MLNSFLNFYIFLRELYENFKENKIIEKATSLSYITFIGFFPALSGFIYIYSFIFKDYEIKIEKFLSQIFFTQEGLKEYLFEFISHNKSLGAISIIFSFIISIKLLFSIERAINSLWFIEKKRNFFQRISSFTLFLFWGPVLYGIYETIYHIFLKKIAFPQFFDFIFPKFVFFLLFAMVIKTIPMASVSFSSAFLGSFITSIFLYILKFGFLAYFKIFKEINIFTGSLGLALIFIITVNLFWVAILLGVLISYVKENFFILKEKLHFKNIPLGDYQIYFSLKILYILYEKFKKGEKLPSKGQLSFLLLIEAKRLDYLLDALKRGSFIIEGKDGSIGLLRDLATIDLREVVLLFLEDLLKVPKFFAKDLSLPLEKYLINFNEKIREFSPSLKFSDIEKT